MQKHVLPLKELSEEAERLLAEQWESSLEGLEKLLLGSAWKQHSKKTDKMDAVSNSSWKSWMCIVGASAKAAA